MSKFIQVNKMPYNSSLKKHMMSSFDSLINTDKIIEIAPRPLCDASNDSFDGKSACHVLMESGDMFYVYGSFSEIKMKVMGAE